MFTDKQRAVLRFVTTMITNDTAASAERFEEMRAFFDEPQIVEIGFAIATLAGMNLFNNMFDIEPEPEQMVSYTGLEQA